MANRWTNDQEQAIRLHERNLLVSAAAGSGKTAVLVERIIRMITGENAVDVDRLLVLTFTRAAASEMKERVALRLDEMLKENPADEGLKRQAALIGHSQITTIDSFCLRVVRDYFGELELDPDFRIGDPGELTLLQADCMDRLLEDCYALGDAAYLDFAESFGGRKNDDNLSGFIMTLYNFARSYPYPDKWMEQALASYECRDEEELEKTPWICFLKEYYKLLFSELSDEIRSLFPLCRQADGPLKYEAMLASDLSQLAACADASTFSSLLKTAQGVKFTRKPTIGKKEEVDPELKEAVSAGRDRVKASAAKVFKKLAEFDTEEILNSLGKIKEPMEILVGLVKKFDQYYSQTKTEKNILDFGDVEHLALNILVDEDGNRTRPALQLRDQFYEILIDEYQDSNFLQDMILESISGKADGRPNMFMVGDVKQSIYRFRMARPEIFMKRYETYSLKESDYQKINLSKNFRSRKEVLLGINRIFYRIMQKSLGDVAYDDAAALYPGMEYPPVPEELKAVYPHRFITDEEHPALKLTLIDLDEKKVAAFKNETDIEAEVDMVHAEAHAAALEIRRITDSVTGQLIFDKSMGGYRPASYKDIVILLRSPSARVESWLDVLTAEGIPAAAAATGYFDALEVKIMLSLLQVLDNPCQDIPFAALLTSPIGNFSAVELAEIAACFKSASADKQSDFYSCCSYYTQEGENEELKERLSAFLIRLESYRDRAETSRAYELIEYLYEDTGYYAYVSAMPAGSVRRMNLDMLVEKAISYERTSYRGLFHFIRYMEHLKKYEVDLTQGSVFGEQDDMVSICSIHASKGLEYPVVILGGISSKINQSDSRAAIVMHADLGIASDYIDTEKRYRMPTAAGLAIEEKLKLDTLGEELRLLYVAMTRARESLIMIGADPYLEKHMEDKGSMIYGKEPVLFSGLIGAGSYLDWILMAGGNELDRLMEVCVRKVEEVFTPAALSKAMDELLADSLQAKTRQILEREKTDPYLVELSGVSERIYPYDAETRIQSKFSVSELKKLAMQGIEEVREDEDLILPSLAPLPSFMEEKAAEGAAARRGTAFHRVMELLDPKDAYHTEHIRECLLDFIARGKITKEAADTVNLFQIYTFYQSDLGKRYAKARKAGLLRTEQQFILSMDAKEALSSYESEEPVLLQGIIDAFFEEAGQIILIDYKTDRYVDEKILKDRYMRQFELYRKAIESITGKTVRESYIWSFTLGLAVDMQE